ncbi:MAG: molybdenum cofactor biosynthesis protein [Phascolarctobacterium sp.]|nr:molybdenum cofactor biosynthesis protein [Phascolarctobacterium sp.]MBR5588920.1 molybdenum cofactor biosynthesis protein [Phascolarctobacterium sp.]
MVMQLEGIVKAICISTARGTEKHAVEEANFIKDYGIEGDAHAGKWHRQVSLLSYNKVEEFNAKGGNVDDGAFGENVLVSGLDFKNLPVGTILKCGDVVLEMTQIGKECHSHCNIFHRVGDCIMPREGVFATVKNGGLMKTGDTMRAELPKVDAPLRAAVMTLSDKGFAGERVDESGPKAVAMLQAVGYEIVETLLLPDVQKKIERELIRLADSRQVDLIITTGGTGMSVRDCTPEATLAVATRNVPGIAEAIRAGSMAITKRAMLGRGASVLRNNTLIVNLPGSVKAVHESLEIVLPELEHGIRILKGSANECGR